jgi:hypothetical protein
MLSELFITSTHRYLFWENPGRLIQKQFGSKELKF